MYTKKLSLRKFPTVFLIMTYMVLFIGITCTPACTLTDNNTQTESSNEFTSIVDVVSSENSEESSNSEPVDTVSGTTKTPTEQLLAGEVVAVINNHEPHFFIEWFCENTLSEYGTIIDLSQLEMVSYPYFENFTLYSSAYNVTFSHNEVKTEKIIVILYGSIPSLPGRCTLIDGELSDTSYFSLEDNWEKVKSNAVFGQYAGEFPKTICSEGMESFDLGTLIGKNRNVLLSIPISDTTVAVISNLYRDLKPSDLKIDLINIETKKSVCNSYSLSEIEKQGYSYSSDVYNSYFDGNTIVFNLDLNEIDYFLWVEINLNSEKVLNYTITKNTFTGWEEEAPYIKYRYLHSESGQYSTFHKDGDLYLHDNTNNVDMLVYDSIIDDINSIEYYKYADEAFFDGNVLYYNIDHYESCLGSACYNPETKETKQYFNRIHIDDYVNGFIYGSTGWLENDYFYGRFNINKPNVIEKLITDRNELTASSFKYTSDKKYIVEIINPNYANDDDSFEKISTISLFDAQSFQKVKTYTYCSVSSYISKCIIVGDYIYMSVNDTYNDVYLIKIN